MVVVRLRLEFPLVDRAAAPLCFDAVFGGQMLREELMSSGDPSVERERPLVADGNREPRMNKTLPVVRVVDDMPDCPFPGDIRNHPVESEPVALLFAVFGHGFRGCADVSAMRRQDHSCVGTLTAELIDDIG